jgi:hypothetical protein
MIFFSSHHTSNGKSHPSEPRFVPPTADPSDEDSLPVEGLNKTRDVYVIKKIFTKYC